MNRQAIRRARKNRAGQRAPRKVAAMRASGRRRPASQEALWAACIAENPGIIGDIVDFIAGARTRLIESQPLEPGVPTRRRKAS